MGNRFDGKVAVVSGGGRGIGRAVALLLAEEGASVVVNDLGCDTNGTGHQTGPADDVVGEVRRVGGRAVAAYQDVSTMTGAEALVRKAVDDYGRLDILVNSVGVRRDGMIAEMTPEDWDAVVRNSLKGVFTVTKYACGQMRQQGNGRIVNMVSDAGINSTGMSNYAAATEGVVGLTRTVALEMERYGVTCNAVSPLAKTRLFPDMDNAPGPFDSRGPQDGSGSWDAPEHAAPLIAYLCTDGAASVSGRVFGVRGGDVYLYADPQVQRAIYAPGLFSLEQLDDMVPGVLLNDG